jgi:nitrogen fixation/metabolism regulation signal transduction histidine kinase
VENSSGLGLTIVKQIVEAHNDPKLPTLDKSANFYFGALIT